MPISMSSVWFIFVNATITVSIRNKFSTSVKCCDLARFFFPEICCLLKYKLAVSSSFDRSTIPDVFPCVCIHPLTGISQGLFDVSLVSKRVFSL